MFRDFFIPGDNFEAKNIFPVTNLQPSMGSLIHYVFKTLHEVSTRVTYKETGDPARLPVHGRLGQMK